MDCKKVLYQGNVKEVTLPGEEEEITFMDFHQPLLCRLSKGSVRMRTPDGEIKIKGGIAKMYRNELVLLVPR